MMQRLAQALVTLFAALAAGSSLAQSIDYDPRRAPELRACDDHQHRGRVEQARTCYSQLVNSPNPIMQAEAYWALGDLQRANECFRDFTRANARAVQPRIRWARLFLQTHQYNDAAELFRDALKIFPNDPHAKIGLARVLAERFDGEAGPLLEEVLREDDQLVEAQLLSAQLALEAGQVEAAQQALERAGDLAAKQKLPPLDVFAMRAALESSRDRDPAPWIKRALDYNPRYGAVYEQLAHFEIMRRRYREATTLLRRAIEVQPDLWSAHAELGSNLLRLGQVEDARAQLTGRVLRRSVQPDDRQLAAPARSHRSSSMFRRRRSQSPATPMSCDCGCIAASRRCWSRMRSSSYSRASRRSRVATGSSCRSR